MAAAKSIAQMKTNRHQFVEIAGLIAIVASLVFVGMQLLLDRELAAAEQYSFRAESRMETLRAHLGSDDYISAMVTVFESDGRAPPFYDEEFAKLANQNNVSTREVIIFWIEEELNMLTWDNLYYQYNQGLLEEEFWLGAKQSLIFALQSPFRRALLINGYFRRPINNLIDELLNELDLEQQNI